MTMQRSVTQMRPKYDPKAPTYAPQRDLANIFLPMMKEVFVGLSADHWNPFFKEWFDREGISDDELGRTVQAIVDACVLFTRDPSIDSPMDAFEKAGLTALPDVVKYSVFCRIGEVLMGGFFVAIRDVTLQGVEAATHSDMAVMIAAGRQLSDRLSGILGNHDVSDTETMRALLSERSRVIEQQLRLMQTTNLEADRAKAQLAAQKPLQDALDAVKSRGGISRFFGTAAVFWRYYRGQYVQRR